VDENALIMPLRSLRAGRGRLRIFIGQIICDKKMYASFVFPVLSFCSLIESRIHLTWRSYQGPWLRPPMRTKTSLHTPHLQRQRLQHTRYPITARKISRPRLLHHTPAARHIISEVHWGSWIFVGCCLDTIIFVKVAGMSSRTRPPTDHTLDRRVASSPLPSSLIALDDLWSAALHHDR